MGEAEAANDATLRAQVDEVRLRPVVV